MVNQQTSQVLPRHIPAIAKLLCITFPNERDDLETDLARLQSVLVDKSHGPILMIQSGAEENHEVGSGKVLGFIDGFMTEAPDGTKRWEIDLLAVDSEWQGKGIGKTLIAKSFEEARIREADLARALIRVDNLPCQRAFAYNGFRKRHPAFALFICTKATENMTAASLLPHGAYLVLVDTCLYRGYWIESLDGNITAEVLESTISCLNNPKLATAPDAEILGGLLPLRSDQDSLMDYPQGYDLVGKFEWWEKQVTHFTD